MRDGRWERRRAEDTSHGDPDGVMDAMNAEMSEAVLPSMGFPPFTRSVATPAVVVDSAPGSDQHQERGRDQPGNHVAPSSAITRVRSRTAVRLWSPARFIHAI